MVSEDTRSQTLHHTDAEISTRTALRLEPIRLWPTVEWFVVVILVLLFAGRGLLPGWRSLNTDFPNYYLAASLVRRGIPIDRIYEWTWLQRQNDYLGVRDGLVSFAPNPPACALVALPLTSFSPLTAKRVWLILNLGFLLIALETLRRVTRVRWRRLLLIVLLCIVPLRMNFLYGQLYVFILLLISAAYYASCRGRQFAAGLLLGVAAALKIFPAVFLILFLWKRNWRAVGGMIASAAVLSGISVGVLGLEVHRVFFYEVLPQTSRGDWLGPYYYLQRNSFITLWSHLFLYAPEANPSPLVDSRFLYSAAQALTVTLLFVGFLMSIAKKESTRAMALEWATLVPLALLISTQSGIYHATVLIFSAVIGFDVLRTHRQAAFLFLTFYALACAPLPGSLLKLVPVWQLLAITALYVLLLLGPWAGRTLQISTGWMVAAFGVAVLLTASNLSLTRHREEDFGRRFWVAGDAYRPTPIRGGVAFAEMQHRRYQAVVFQDGIRHDISSSGDILAMSGAGQSPSLFLEVSNRQSSIVQASLESLEASPQFVSAGQEPTISPNGKWLAFIREDRGRNAVWSLSLSSAEAPRMMLESSYHPIDITVSSDGDVIAAAGKTSDPHLVLVNHASGTVSPVPGFPHPARYPSISPDGKRLAFSMRNSGWWRLFVRDLATGSQQQLTRASCNAISPSWKDDHTVIYATDCGRGIGRSAIAWASVAE
jgi:hypothetical protein